MNRRAFLATSAAVITASRTHAAEPSVRAFKGIRYGADTSGARRFMPPQKVPVQKDFSTATAYGPEAPQPHPHTEIPEVRATITDHTVGEDCLRLNIWTPSTTGKHPVMVWFHGGGFSSGNGGYTIYEGANMAKRHDVVMVTINHRLNSFGFTDLSAFGGGTNVGMLDCVLALEWVRDNIAGFGGDPQNVTIFGQSGGGAKVSTLLAMPAAKGLFHRAIIESGSYLTGVPKADALKSTEAFMAKLGAKSLADLQKLPMDQIIAATSSTQGLRLTPVIDPGSLPVNPFSPTAPAISANVPILIGTTETEVTFFPGQGIDPIDAATLFTRAKAAVPGATEAQIKDLLDVYRKGRPKASDIDLALILESDARFRTVVTTQAELKSAQPAPVYMYYFTWRTPVRDGKLRSLHCLEIPFATANVDGAQSMTGTGKDRYALEAKVSGAWASFARTGSPSAKGLPTWPKFDTTTRATMILDNECKVINDPNSAERKAVAALRQK
ncbi:MAG: carboxylesterase family protein [Acidobacteriota bacterium]